MRHKERSSCIVNTIAADALVMQGTTASVAMASTKLPRKSAEAEWRGYPAKRALSAMRKHGG